MLEPAGQQPSRHAWDSAVERYGGDLLQSWDWGEFKQRHGWSAERVMLEDASGVALAQVLVRRRGPFALAYLPRGPILEGNEALGLQLLDRIDAVCSRRRAIELVVEPARPLPPAWHAHGIGFTRGVSSIQTPRTVIVTLASDEELLARMRRDTRHNIANARRRGVSVEPTPSTGEHKARFYRLLTDTANRNQFGIHEQKYYDDFLDQFGGAAVLLFTVNEGVTTAGLIAARAGSRARSMYSGSATGQRGRGDAALLRFAAMRWAREQGCSHYDLGGIASTTDRQGDLHGVDVFKTGFGGEIVSCPETLERHYRPALAWLLRRLSSRFRAVASGTLVADRGTT